MMEKESKAPIQINKMSLSIKVHCQKWNNKQQAAFLQNQLRLMCLWPGAKEKAHITVPHRMVEKHKKAVLKSTVEKQQSKRNYKGQAIISCKRKEFNHYKGQTYSNFSPGILASRGWKHSKSQGDYFTINAFKGNPALEMDGEVYAHNFKELGIDERIADALQKFDIIKPTNVQAMAIPHLLKGKNVLCAAETGSGKTLAFLLPIIQRLLQHNKDFGMNDRPNRPYGLILVPSRELADQIATVATDLGQVIGFDSFSQGGGRRTQKTLRERPRRNMDILVATPGVLSKILTNRIYDLSRLSTVVLDEIDTLMDDSFNDVTLRILMNINKLCGTFGAEPVTMTDIPGHEDSSYDDNSDAEDVTGLQVVLTGATMPKGLKDIAGDILPLETMVHIKTNQLHKLMPHVSQKFHRVSSVNKVELLLKHVKQNQGNKVPTIVFCNNSKTVVFLKRTLEESNIESLCFHAQMSSQAREHLFEKFQEGFCDILICTDLASRGLDTIRVQHVINYDFPLYMSDYIHRAGRVGRVGSQNAGFVLNFVTKKWDVDLLWKIETAARRITELHNVNANIKRKLNYIVSEKFNTKENIEINVES